MNGTFLQNLDQMEEAIGLAGEDPEPYRPGLDRIREHLDRYRTLETELLGHVEVAVPRPLVTGGGEVSLEELAHGERERLGLAGNDAGSLMAGLDREGIKVAVMEFPPDSPFSGFFLFDHAAGPVLVADRGLAPADQDLVFARLYGHFLLDHDPYRIILVRAEEDPADPVAARAREFAGAFLIDGEELKRYLEAVSWRGEGTLSDEIFAQLLAYFAVSPETLSVRLESLGFPGADPASVFPDPKPMTGPGAGGSLLPERFVRLALEAHARGMIDLDELAEHLDTDRDAARSLAGRFRLES